jgi:hypothetical protein
MALTRRRRPKRGHAARKKLPIFAAGQAAMTPFQGIRERLLVTVGPTVDERCGEFKIVNVSGCHARTTLRRVSHLLTRQVPPNVSGHTTLAHWTSPLTNKRTQSATIGKTNRARYLGTPPKTQCWHRCQIEAIKMTVQKKILVTNRVRHPADGGFSWVDRRFLREFSERLSGDAVFMYLFLAAVSDKHGLSFYSDQTIARQLRVRFAAVVDAREELIRLDLIAHSAPLTQVLSLPSEVQQRRLWS